MLKYMPSPSFPGRHQRPRPQHREVQGRRQPQDRHHVIRQRHPQLRTGTGGNEALI